MRGTVIPGSWPYREPLSFHTQERKIWKWHHTWTCVSSECFGILELHLRKKRAENRSNINPNHITDASTQNPFVIISYQHEVWFIVKVSVASALKNSSLLSVIFFKGFVTRFKRTEKPAIKQMSLTTKAFQEFNRPAESIMSGLKHKKEYTVKHCPLWCQVESMLLWHSEKDVGGSLLVTWKITPNVLHHNF